MTERRELIARLRDAAIYGPTPCPVCDEAADMLEADAQPDVPETNFGNMPAEPQEPY